jgi:hypothetical protein
MALCCDACPTSGGVRKVKCPFGYCPASALCAECRKKHKDKLGKKHHRERGCEKNHLEYVAEEKDRWEKINAGKAVLKAAVGLFDGTGMVCVTFDQGGKWIDYRMHKSIYDQRDGMLANPTLDMFKVLGEVTPVGDVTGRMTS